MPRMIRTARGENVDFDAIIIKQQLAQAPMNIEVAQRKRFIDSKEEKPKRTFIDHNATNQPTVNVVVPTDEQIAAASRKEADFEPDAGAQVSGPMDGPIPVLPVRTKKA
jgi:hypothetical protein